MKKYVRGELTTKINHENGIASKLGENPNEKLAQLGKERWKKGTELIGNGESMQKVTETKQIKIPKFDFKSTLQPSSRDGPTGLALEVNEDGPVAMTYEVDVGWVVDKLGPNSGHWKRRARASPGNDNKEELGPIHKKREGPISLEELDQSTREIKRKKIEAQSKENIRKEIIKDGDVAGAARQLRRA